MKREDLYNKIKERNTEIASSSMTKMIISVLVIIGLIIYLKNTNGDIPDIMILVIPWGFMISIGVFFYQKAKRKLAKSFIEDPTKYWIFDEVESPEEFINLLEDIEKKKKYDDGVITITKDYIKYKNYLDEDFRILLLKNISQFQKVNANYKGILLFDESIKDTCVLVYEPKDYKKIDEAISAIKNFIPDAYIDKVKGKYANLANETHYNHHINILGKEKEHIPDEKPEESIKKEPKELKPVEGRRTTKTTKPIKEEPKEEVVEKVVEKPTSKRTTKTTKTTTKTKEKDMNTKYEELKKLKELLDSDILTKEEFEKEKNKILKD